MPARDSDSEIDELTPREPLPLIRFCQVYKVPGNHRTAAQRRKSDRCRQLARPGGNTCHEHYREAMQRWRARRRLAHQSAGGASPTAPSSSAAAVTARVRTHRDLKYGIAEKGPCVVCLGRKNVIAVRRDQSKPEEYVWACRTHRYDLIHDRSEVQKARDQEAARALASKRLAETRKTALELLASAPADVAAAIHAEVGAMMLGSIPLRPGMPAYNQKLALLAESRLRSRD